MSNYTQVERNGLFELTDAARSELASSKYYNEDLAPTSVSQRTWTTYNITMLWVGMSICVPSLSLASGLIVMGVSPWLSVINVALGNLIILIPIQMNSQIGTKYGIPFPLFARLTFGSKGAHLPALLRAFTACGWTSVQAWVGGGAVAAIIGCFASKFADSTWIINLPSWSGMQATSAATFIGYIIFILFIVWVAYNGIENIKWVQNIGGPILIVVMIALLIWSAKTASNAGYSFGDVLNQKSDQALIDKNGGFALVYLAGLMGNIAFWATMALNIPDFSRYARSQKDQFLGQLIGMPVPMFFCAFVGAFFAQATKLSTGTALFDPTGVFYLLENKIIVFIAAVGVIMATITTCVAANVVAPANGFSNISPKRISYKKGVIITVCLAFFILQAWWIYGSGAAYFTWMNAYGTILAPIAAIFIADYFVCKKKRVDVAALFQEEGGRYWYNGGVNPAAIIAWFVSFIFPLLTYFGVKGGFWTFINSINYVWSFAIGFIVYILLMKTSMKGNSYIEEDEYESFTERS
ncbi:MAG: NCS1 family nucleobase:cation symporter-1 [Eubacteriaceae bacterium]|nr:NCS1 family nucleobase:cation symporter-1 [Eubacteriaceae bacterium]